MNVRMRVTPAQRDEWAVAENRCGAPAAKVIAELFGGADGMSRGMKVRLCATCSGAHALERSAKIYADVRRTLARGQPT